MSTLLDYVIRSYIIQARSVRSKSILVKTAARSVVVNKYLPSSTEER